MKFLVLFLLSLSSLSHASVPELFGSSAASIAVGNQARSQSADNNYYASALLGFSEKTQFSFNSFYIDTAFTEVNNVVVKNRTNTINESQIDDVEVNPTPTTMFGMHFSTPLFSPTGPKFNFSFFAPYDRLMEADTGDPYQPQYVMYANRFIRPVIIFSGAQSFGDWSFSAGAHTGFQSNGESYFATRSTSGEYSTGKMTFNAKPSISAIASVAKRTNNHTTYLSFEQEMKSKLENRATGETEIAGNAAFQFDFDIAALLYYDPMTLRLGHQFETTSAKVYTSIEYQQWDSFEASTLKFKKRGGTINGSRDHENLKLRNIFVPKLGFERSLSELWTAKAGYFYRQSPLKTSNLKNAGNTIDVDKHVGSLGLARLVRFYEKDVMLDLAYQAHLLRNQKIKKTPGSEDGDPSESKIGSPGYRVGGMIHVVSVGLSWMY